jgi:hypothetical protein
LTLDLVPIGTIEGVAVNPGGPVPELTMTIASGAPSLPGVFGMTSLSGRPGSRNDPSFKFVNVTPGHYTITARTSNSRTVYMDGGGFKSEPVEPGSVPIRLLAAEVDWAAERASHDWAFHNDDAWAWHVHAFALREQTRGKCQHCQQQFPSHDVIFPFTSMDDRP